MLCTKEYNTKSEKEHYARTESEWEIYKHLHGGRVSMYTVQQGDDMSYAGVLVVIVVMMMSCFTVLR